MNLNEKSVDQLKALAYDLSLRMEQDRQNIMIIQQAIRDKVKAEMESTKEEVVTEA